MTDDDLTQLLQAYAVAEPGPDLRARIIAAAPRERTLGRAWRWAAGLALGVGLAASGAAGVAAGFTLAPASLTRAITGPGNSTVDAGASAGADESALADPAGDAASG